MQCFDQIVKLLRYAVICFILAHSFEGVRAQSSDIRIVLPVNPQFRLHEQLLSYPGYLALALENAGLSPSSSSRLAVGAGGLSAGIRIASLRMMEQRGATYVYEASINAGIAGIESAVRFPVTLDISNLESGSVALALAPPLASFVPQEMVDRIKFKLGLIANPSAQEGFLRYLSKIQSGVSASTVSAVHIAILEDAYLRSGRNSVSNAVDCGDAVPLSDQWLFFLTMLIWFLAMPALLFRIHVRKQNRTSAP